MPPKIIIETETESIVLEEEHSLGSLEDMILITALIKRIRRKTNRNNKKQAEEMLVNFRRSLVLMNTLRE